MNLLDESFQKKEEKKGNFAKNVVLVLIILVVLIICAIFITITTIRKNTLRVYLNGQANENIKNMLVFEDDEEQGKIIYAPIKNIADQLGVKCSRGEYKHPSEANNKCCIENEQEAANILLGTNKIYKIDLTEDKNKEGNYEYVYCDKPIKAIDGVLYASEDALEKAFNITIEYDENSHQIKIYTLPKLVELWNQKVLDYGYANISEIYANQKAILNEMLVVESNDKMVGVIDLEGNDILEPKYDKIKYLANIGEGTDFLVSSNKKVGIMSNNRKVKIPINYDSIELLDIDSKLYIVKNDNKYGVMDFNGSKIIYIENETIGIDVSKFSQNELKNKYILADNLIPAKKNSKWALYNKKGEIVSDGYIYDNIGYTSDSSKKDIYNLVVIPEYNIVIAKKGNYYVMITQGGEELLQGVPLDDVYMVINGDTKQYLISANNITYNAVDLLEKIGIKKSRNEVNEQSTTENAIIDDSEQNANKNNTTNEQKNNEATNTTNVKQENNTEIQNNENINTTNETNETNEQNNVANETNQQNEQQDNQQNSNTESTGADVIFY